MPDFSTILSIPEVREIVQHLAYKHALRKKQAMPTQPTIQSFGFSHDYVPSAEGETTAIPVLNVSIAVPNALVGATLLAHITALVSQYQNVEAQVAAAESKPVVVPDPAPPQTAQTPAPAAEAKPEPAPAAAPTVKRSTPAKPKKSAPPRTPEAVAAAVEAKQPAPETPAQPESTPAPVQAAAPVETPVAPGPTTEAAAPAKVEGADAADCPAAVASATSFRKVVEWMLDHGYENVDVIVEKCEQYAPHSGAIARASKAGNPAALRDRVERGLDVVRKSRGIAA